MLLSNQLSLALRLSTVLLAFAALASCATLNEDECRSVDWTQLGQQDGVAGHPSSYIDNHRSACAEHKLPVDEQQWSAGWEQGIRLFCTPQNGLIHGREGRSYANSCPMEVKTDFEGAYSVSKALYDARNSRDRLQRELDSLLDARDKAEKPEDRQRISREIDTKRSAVRMAERRLWDAEGDYDIYVASQGLMRR
jgi:signal transduction histidine kinase